MTRFAGRCLAILLGLGCYSAGFANVSYFCMQHARVIQSGDTPSTVLAACGQPQQKIPQTIHTESNTHMQEWIYYRRHQVASNLDRQYPWHHRIAMVITLQDNKVIAIKSPGVFGRELSCVKGATLHIGDAADMVRLACGFPNHIRQFDSPVPLTQQGELWIYQTNATLPKTQVEFINGRVVNISH